MFYKITFVDNKAIKESINDNLFYDLIPRNNFKTNVY